jgi:two-component system C4-dicarboxylate transport sensor histidine kinase DctB
LDLKASRADSAALREANARLEAEIEERRTAERRLARTQGELERASRLAVLGKLATSVTHELGQPIAAMRNYITAAEMADTPKKLADSLPRFASLVTRMQHITEQLRFFARPGSDQFEPVDMLASVEAALDLLAPNLEQHKVQVNIKTPEATVPIRGNRLRLEQVLTNILRNAVDAMADSSKRHLTVIIEEVGDQAVLLVKDTGPGLGDSSLETLQEPFFTTKASGEGMGLGLAISMEIVVEHGGTMQAFTQETGGACLRITLPLEAQMKDVA